MPATFWLLFSLLAIIGPTEANWGNKFFNPKPAEGDLVLPMPCGGAMAFAKVEIPATDWVDGQSIRLGGEDDDLAYAEGIRNQSISGSFSDGRRPGHRHYWIGKYEVSELQWQSLQGDCPTPGIAGRSPKTEVSWFDSVQFAQRYSEWLYKNAIERLPTEDDVPGFVRLPTETEWEYAARGGVSVSEDEFRARTFPTPNGLNRYIWYQGSESAGGKLHPAGLLRPNPLGLYDMLGNAEEIVLEPFRLNVPGRLHGQAGGFVTKGAHYLSGRSSIRSAYRREFPHYDFDQATPTRIRTIGFRLVVSGTVIPTHERLAAIKENLSRLSPLMAGGTTPTDIENLRRENARLIAQLREMGWQTPAMDERITTDQVTAIVVKSETALSILLVLGTLLMGLRMRFVQKKRLNRRFWISSGKELADIDRRILARLLIALFTISLFWLAILGLISEVWGITPHTSRAALIFLSIALFVLAGFWLVANLRVRRLSAEPAFRDHLQDGSQGPEMVEIPAGSFEMGDLQGNGVSDEQPVHRVKISQSFALGKYPVTFEEYDHFCVSTDRTKPRDEGWGRARRPVINISWNDAAAYVEWLSAQTGEHYRLPTEAEWEYASRSGGEEPTYSGVNGLNQDGWQAEGNWAAWYLKNSGGKTHRVGSTRANALALYDMSGNVYEWIQDGYDKDYYERSPVQDPVNNQLTDRRVIRGGSWKSEPKGLRFAFRNSLKPDDKCTIVGLRLARTVSETTKDLEAIFNTDDIQEDSGGKQIPILKESLHPAEPKRGGNQPPILRENLRAEFHQPVLIKIPAGSFLMGDRRGDGDSNEQPVHTVEITRPFALGKYPVTFEEYDQFCESTGKGKPNDEGWGRGQRPVVNVTSHDAVAYTEWLSEQTGGQYRLPSEAEWEYACRSGGKNENYAGGEDPDLVAWYSKNTGGNTQPVGAKAANGLGLHDMCGNVWEWVQDGYDEDYYAHSPRKDPVNEKPTISRVLRGGSWLNQARWVRCAYRDEYSPSLGNRLIGFRLARSISETTKEPEMVEIPAGSFEMGDQQGDGDSDEQPVHRIEITRAFALSKYPVTFEEYDYFCEATNRAKPKDEGWGRGRQPVIYVSWDDAVAYAEWLSEQTREHYRLPTEAEWEYACCNAGSDLLAQIAWPTIVVSWQNAVDYVAWFSEQSGRHYRPPTKTEWEHVCRRKEKWESTADGESLDQIAWYHNNSGNRTHTVGAKAANILGLYDTRGNVWEWVQDEYDQDYYTNSPHSDPVNNRTNYGFRVLRGGSWLHDKRGLRCTNRVGKKSDAGNWNVGFRLARSISEISVAPLQGNDETEKIPVLTEALYKMDSAQEKAQTLIIPSKQSKPGYIYVEEYSQETGKPVNLIIEEIRVKDLDGYQGGVNWFVKTTPSNHPEVRDPPVLEMIVTSVGNSHMSKLAGRDQSDKIPLLSDTIHTIDSEQEKIQAPVTPPKKSKPGYISVEEYAQATSRPVNVIIEEIRTKDLDGYEEGVHWFVKPIPTKHSESRKSLDSKKVELGGDETSIFSPAGRFSRLSFLAWSVLSFIVLSMFIALGEQLGSGWIGLIAIIFVVLQLIFVIRRLHDLNASGWWAVLGFIPWVQYIVGIVLLLAPGTNDSNQYGPPRKTLSLEKFTGVLLLLIFLISLLAK